ncbi:hypothetical protein POTOM_030215 [Populus tomentosa]|uniref:Bax inhibitor-1 family protein n=1 Tax=Populus tomentosa TaxID=118781 RepID=A0A8X7Z6T2_POPTO|nr:hypothetical protein POTOM_030215 [Populus tomentosa]
MESNNEKGFDMEAGISNQLYPMMQEPPQLRWAFIRKVYIILAMQLLLTGVSAPAVCGKNQRIINVESGCCILLLTGRIVLEAAILTCVVVVGLTLYTFWAAKRGQDFSFLGPFLFSAVLVLIAFGLIQFLFPLGKWSLMIYGCLGAIVFSGFIVYDTDNLIKRFSYDEYISAAINLYLDIINLFLALLNIFNAVDS